MKRLIRPEILVALLGAALYLLTLSGTFVYDDVEAIRDQGNMHQPATWGKLWTRPYWELSADHLYRPLASQSYALQWWMHGAVVWPYHLVNVLLYAVICVLVVRLATHFSGAKVAWAAGIIFAVHPVHVEVVSNIVGRAELLCTIFTVSAMLLLVRRPLTMPRSVLIAICSILAVLSKEQGVLVLFLLLIQWRLQDDRKPIDADERTALQTLFVLCSFSLLGYVVLRELILNVKLTFEAAQIGWAINPLAYSKGLDRLLIPVTILGRYAVLLIAPLHLSIHYGAMVISDKIDFADPYFWIGCGATGLLLAAPVLLWRRRSFKLLMMLLCFGLTYALISNTFSLIGTIMTERLLFLPSVFFSLLVAMILSRMPLMWLRGVVGVILVLGAVRSVTYADQWHDAQRLYGYSLEHQPRSIHVHLLAMSNFMLNHDYAAAERVANIARQRFPDDTSILSCSAEIALEQNRLDDAQLYLERCQLFGRDLRTAALAGRLSRARAATRPATLPVHLQDSGRH